jgi:hypothetical protein
MRESWKTVEGFEEYEVSNLGRIKRIVAGKGIAKKGNLLKPSANSKGYLYVVLTRNNRGLKRLSKRLHVLVAKAFLPNPDGLPEVNHKGPKTDCRAHKLEWCDKETHSLDVMKRSQRGEGANFHKLSGRWRASLFSREKRKHLGWFDTKAQALRARKSALKKLEERQ